MKKVWLVFANEYKRHVLRKRFIFAILSMPIFIIFLVGVGVLAVAVQFDGTPVGYVDASGFLKDAKPLPAQTDALFPPVPVQAYPNEAAARTDLASGKLQAIFLIAPDYMQSGSVQMVTKSLANQNAQDDFINFLRFNLLQSQSKAVAERLTNGNKFTTQSADGSRSMGEDNILGIILPLFAGILFMIAVNSSGGYLMQAVVEEKENRTMEIVITSLSPNQLMAGKIMGNLGVGLTELIAWIGFALLGIVAAKRFLPFGANLDIGGNYVLLIALTFLPAFVLVAALMATVGSVATESREAQQMAGLFTLPIFIPYWFVTPIIMNPNSPLAVGLSLFPMTAPVTLPLRAAFTNIPAWQIALSLSLLVICAVGAVWLAGRVFRLGMLRYGKRLSWKEIFARA